MIEPLDSLVFSLHSKKGAYALLLGSGVSRAAGIPTGWEVVLDLIRKLARSRGQDAGARPEQWYRESVGEDPSYSALLHQLAGSRAERQQLLRGYFEPTEEEREEGKKVPTRAHKAIAKLAQMGHVRVILTTNFDRLAEHALEEAGLSPTVMSSSADAEGALPLVHQQLVVVKLHGDYRAPDQLKNTDDELAEYDPNMERLLSRVLDEFGLIVCGWSGEWDVALADSIARVEGHRFTTYWTARGELRQRAQDLVQLRRAQVIEISDADGFFGALDERLTSLAEYDRPHPLSTAMAVETVKRYVVDDRNVVRLHDLVSEETNRARNLLSDRKRFRFTGFDAPFGPELENVVQQTFFETMAGYEAILETLEAVLATGCYWGSAAHIGIWAASIQTIASLPRPEGGFDQRLNNLIRYPGLRLLYAAGVAATASRNFTTLFSVLNRPRVLPSRRPAQLLSETLDANSVLYGRWLQIRNPVERPASERLADTLRDSFTEVLREDQEYEETFDLFEFLVAANHVHRSTQVVHPPVGRLDAEDRWTVVRRLQEEVSQMGEEHALLRAGLFDGSPERFLESFMAVQVISRLPASSR